MDQEEGSPAAVQKSPYHPTLIPGTRSLNLADSITVQPAERDEGRFSNSSKKAAEAAKRQATTAALRREVNHDSWRQAGEWCLTNTAKFLLITCGAFWAIVFAAILIDVFGQVAHHFWHPVGHAVD